MVSNKPISASDDRHKNFSQVIESGFTPDQPLNFESQLTTQTVNRLPIIITSSTQLNNRQLEVLSKHKQRGFNASLTFVVLTTDNGPLPYKFKETLKGYDHSRIRSWTLQNKSNYLWTQSSLKITDNGTMAE